MALSRSMSVFEQPEQVAPAKAAVESCYGASTPIERDPPVPSTAPEEEMVFVAVGKEVKECKATLDWAIATARATRIGILHVHQPSPLIPTSMGAKFPASKLKPREVKQYREQEREKMHRILDEYVFLCARHEVLAEKLLIEMDEIEKGILELVTQHGITRLVMGAAADKHYSRRMREPKSKKAIFVGRGAPLSCHISFVCKGNLVCTREATLNGIGVWVTPPSPILSPRAATSPSMQSNLRSASQGLRTPNYLTNPVLNLSPRSSTSPSMQSNLRSASQGHGSSNCLTNTMLNFLNHSKSEKSPSVEVAVGILTTSSLEAKGTGTSMPQSKLNLEANDHQLERMSKRNMSVCITRSEGVGSSTSTSGKDTESENEVVMPPVNELEEDDSPTTPLNVQEMEHVSDLGYEQLEQAMAEVEISRNGALGEMVKRHKAENDAMKAIIEAKKMESLYAKETKERIEMEKLLAREMKELDEIKMQQEDALKEMKRACVLQSEMEIQVVNLHNIAIELKKKLSEAEFLIKSLKVERDELQKDLDEAIREAGELQLRNKEASARLPDFSEFTFLDVEEATNGFDPTLKIGQGGYGSVYKGLLRHTPVAIKILDPRSLHGWSEFRQEVDVLSRARHPNLVTLIGTCPEARCLVYEYLSNGSLEDRLLCKGNTPPLSWQTRIQIIADVCSALIFLHSSKPEGIVHGDIKPANILLDANYVSKLGDFGISRLISHMNSVTTRCCITTPKGTFMYIDPEFISTGVLTARSDVYSFGIIIFQLLTGKSDLGILNEVQGALDAGNLHCILDELAGDWPFVQAKQLAHLGLRCCELNRRNRPDLATDVWRVLEPMRASLTSKTSFRMQPKDRACIPSHFICPIFMEIMQDPHIAADGYTYEAEAFRGWLEGGNETSPMTNIKLAHHDMIPNIALKSAIQEWLQKV